MHLSALRERREDIPLLISHFLEGTGKTFKSEAMETLVRFDWPGNVRELENEITKAVLLAGSRAEISADSLSDKFNASGSSTRKQPLNGFNGHDVEFDENYSLYDYLGEHEKRFIIRALKEKRGVKKHAAVELKIPESTLRLKIKQYGIDLKNLDSLH
jgi:DNA-binding NtrC family response regulator